MRAVPLTGFEGFESLRTVEVDTPRPSSNEVLIAVKASGINFAEIELTKGKYPSGKPLPFIMGFEAAGTVAEIGSQVKTVKQGDKVAALVSSGGYAEYATADASACIPIPAGISFAEATTIVVQGLSAYTLLKLAAKPCPTESILIQAAAGGVGLYLVQLAKIMGVKKIVALASTKEKIDLLTSLGVDAAIDYSIAGWTERAKDVLGSNGADIVLKAASGEVGAESMKLAAPFARDRGFSNSRSPQVPRGRETSAI